MSTDLLGLVGGTDLEIKSHCMLNLCLDECATEYQCDNSEMMDDVSTRAPSPLLSRASSLDLDSDMGECAGLAQLDSAYDDDDDDLCLPAACCHDTEEGHVASTYNTLESMNLLSPLCLHLEPIREIADEDVDESDPFSFLSEHPYVMKVTASAAMPPSRKTKGKIASKPSAEPLRNDHYSQMSCSLWMMNLNQSAFKLLLFCWKTLLVSSCEVSSSRSQEMSGISRLCANVSLTAKQLANTG
jgi:hypothetical protein